MVGWNLQTYLNQQLREQGMMLGRTLESADWPVPINDFRKKANLHLLSQRKIFGIGRPRMRHILVDLRRQCGRIYEPRCPSQRLGTRAGIASTGKSGLEHEPVRLPRQASRIVERCDEPGPEAPRIEVVAGAQRGSY